MDRITASLNGVLLLVQGTLGLLLLGLNAGRSTVGELVFWLALYGTVSIAVNVAATRHYQQHHR